MDKKQNALLMVLIVALVGAAFYIGQLSVRLQKAESVGAKTTATVTPTAQAESPISVKNLKEMAKKVGLNTDEFNKCLDDGKTANIVKSDATYGGSIGVSGTPAFFINGLLVAGALPQANFEAIIDAELKNGGGAKLVAELTGEKTVARQKVEMGVGYKKGGENAKVKIVEFTDFQCPYCISVVPTVKALMEKYGDNISLEIRNFPLSFHPYAQKAAEAAQCAGEQNKFWEMHDLIFAASADK